MLVQAPIVSVTTSSAVDPAEDRVNAKKPPCKQGPHGEDVPEILRYLEVYGLAGLVDPSTIQHSRINGRVSEGIVFQLYDRDAAIATLSNSPHFANAHLGFEHNGQVGGGNTDFRGLRWELQPD